MSRSAWVLVFVAVSILGACSNDGSSSPADTASASVTAGVDATVDTNAYCDRIATLEGEHPEAYVGSAEHIADIQSLLGVAPADVMDPLTRFSAFLASGAVDPANPDSNLIDNWPPDVQIALEEIGAFNDFNC